MVNYADLDQTPGQFTTVKLQALLDSGMRPDVSNRRDLAAALKSKGARISVHGVEAWFRRVDSNYNHPRESLHPVSPSFAVPGRHWPLLLDLFTVQAQELERGDDDFGQFCLARTRTDNAPALTAFNTSAPEHLPGREDVFAQLLAELSASSNDAQKCARLLLLEGEAGMGKTSLLEELVRRVRDTGALCVTASCSENVHVPLLPLLDFARLQLGEVARAGSAAVELANRLIDNIEHNTGTAGNDDLFLLGSDLLVTLAREAPLVVVVDDVHWLDDATRNLLVHFSTFLRLNRHHRVVLLLAGREFTAELLHRLPSGEFSRHFKLQPLSKPAIRLATARLLERPMGPRAREYVWEVTQGNPLYVEQLSQHLAASGQLQMMNGLLELAGPVDAVEVPDNLDAYYRQRFGKLDEATAGLLQLAACFGQQLNSEFLHLLSPMESIESVLAALDRSEAAGLLRFSRNAYEFCHPVARHSVYSTIAESARARLHARIAQVVEGATVNRSPHASIEYAYHLVRGRPHTDALNTLNACNEAALHSHRLAAWPNAEYFATAALDLDDNHGGLNDHSRGALLRLRGSSRHQTARPEIALQDFEAALERFQADQNTVEYARTLTQVVRIRANFKQLREGQNAAAEELDGYVSLLGESDREVAANALEVLAGYRLANNDSRGALRIAERVIDEFGDGIEPERYALSRITAGISALNHLDGQTGLTHLLEATSFARASSHAPSLDRAMQRLVLAQLFLGRVNDVFTTFEEIQQVSKSSTSTGEYTTVLAAVSAGLAARGQFEEALGYIADALELVDVTGYAFMETTLVGVEVYCLCRLGQFDGARHAIARLEADRPRRAARLLSSCTVLFESIASGAMSDESVQVSSADRASLLDGRTPDVAELARVVMLGQLSLSKDDPQLLDAVLAKLRTAETAGFVFAAAWPMQLPLLMGSICLRLDRTRDAHYFLRRSLDYSRLHGLTSQLHDLDALLRGDWPEEHELLEEVQLALATSPALDIRAGYAD